MRLGCRVSFTLNQILQEEICTLDNSGMLNTVLRIDHARSWLFFSFSFLFNEKAKSKLVPSLAWQDGLWKKLRWTPRREIVPFGLEHLLQRLLRASAEEQRKHQAAAGSQQPSLLLLLESLKPYFRFFFSTPKREISGIYPNPLFLHLLR